MLGSGCGSDASTREARSPEDVGEDGDEDGATAEDEGGESPEDAPGPAASCEDEACFPCGTGFCLAGWYCDESSSQSPACSWLPECAEKAGCGCIERTLGSACRCQDEGGGSHVTCE